MTSLAANEPKSTAMETNDTTKSSPSFRKAILLSSLIMLLYCPMLALAGESTHQTHPSASISELELQSLFVFSIEIEDSDTTLYVTSCDFHLSPGGTEIWTESGIYVDTLENSMGLDSIIAVELTILESTSSFQSARSCDEPYLWEVNGQTYTESGVYNATLVNAAGCDSNITLALQIGETRFAEQTKNVCDFYTWPINGRTYTESGLYKDTINTLVGCDSIITLNLTIRNSSSSLEEVQVCDSFQWEVNGLTYYESGMYVENLINAAGCDSIVTLDLTILENSFNSIVEFACDSFLWELNGQTYLQSGIYRDTISNIAGCDSIVSLNLTVSNSTHGTEAQTACDSFTWETNGVTYTESGVYSDTLVNQAGCDSVITLQLTILQSSFSQETHTACDSFIWESNGITYTESGTYTDTLMNEAGCDSVVTLELTLLQSTSSQVSETSCDSFTWEINGVTYAESGVYEDTLVNQAGCDSIVSLELIILQSTASEQEETACQFYEAPDGQIIEESGMYDIVVPNAAGCDSLISLDLTVISIDTSITREGVLLISNADPSLEFQWYNCSDDEPIADATGNAYEPTENGSYKVEITDQSCTVFSACIDVIDVSIEQFGNKQGIKLYPNPGDDQLYIHSSSTIQSITVLDITGKIVLQDAFYQSDQPLDASSLLPGIYIIQIQTEKNRLHSLQWIKH
jgi:hypothetical protein